MKEVKYVEIEYPRNEGNIDCIELGLLDVRAADSVRISYDFERDGWIIYQASVFEWDIDDEICDADWQEVAFVRAWGRKYNDYGV
jgi:hypothetical protein